MMHIPVIREESITRMTLRDLQIKIVNEQKPRFGEISLEDFSVVITHPNGVYTFFDNAVGGRCLYVGKVSSRSFIGRLPSHVEPSEEFWMNQLSKYLVTHNVGEHYELGRRRALNTFLLLIGFPVETEEIKITERKARINRLESALRSFLSPDLNSTKLRFAGTEMISDIMSS